ncbi:MAG TPA: chemotaxis response regulator protein-glutamate methylesterase [Polyangiales bacterium]
MIHVLIVDDSPVVREVIAGLLRKQPDIQIVGVAPNPLVALSRMRNKWPDVIVLDIEMPHMNGISFLKQIMRERPTPTVICSSWAEKGMQTTFDALEAGAVSIISRPQVGVAGFLRESERELLDAIRAAANCNVKHLVAGVRVAAKSGATALPATVATPTKAAQRSNDRIVAIGISTGGTQALERVLPALPRTAPGLAIVQHMPRQFTRSFAERLNSVCQIEVKEAEDGDVILPGRALIAPGGRHLLVQRVGNQYIAEVSDGPLVSRHRPSADVLFRSVAKAAGPNAMGMIMTGMGYDGARGLKKMLDAGAHTVAQDEETCVVFGMPGEAIKQGAAQEVIGLPDFAQAIVKFGAETATPTRAGAADRTGR